MRVLYVVHEFFPRFSGGTERHVLNLAHQMQRMGHHAAVLTYGLGEEEAGFGEVAGGMLARTYAYRGVPVVALRHREPPADLGLRIADAQVAEAVGAVLDRAPYEVVHVAHPMRLGACVEAARRRGVPVALTLTDFWLPCPRARFFKPDLSPCNSPEGGEKCARECGFPAAATARHAEAAALFAAADAVIAPSDLVVEVFRRIGWQRAVHRVNHGVERPRTDAGARRPSAGAIVRLGYTGVVAAYKGVDTLLRTFTSVDAPNLTLALHGNALWAEEGFRRELEYLYQCDRRIRLMNRYEHDALPEVMAGVDVMVVPSTTLDSYGLVVAESLAHGVPVIASDMVGAAHELIRDGENGFVYPADRPDRLRELIELVARRPETVERLRAGITPPPCIEEEAFRVELVYRSLLARP
jgi:glycosyltransferase involved in cell wall biosynthesis